MKIYYILLFVCVGAIIFLRAKRGQSLKPILLKFVSVAVILAILMLITLLMEGVF